MTSLQKKSLLSSDTRPTIGLLISSVMGFWKWPWLGVVDGARARGANAVCFAGSVINSKALDYQRNVLFDLARSQRLDGLIVWSSALDGVVGGAGMQRFCERFHPLPLVSVERALDGFPSLLMEDYAGVQATMTHFITQHGYRRIAFLSGAKNHAGAQERYRAYVESLKQHGLPFDRDLVSPPTSSWDQVESNATITAWLAAHRLDFEAIMGVNDAYTLLALEALEARGVRVPDDIAVAGFDAQADGASLIVPLTTVQPPFYELGWRAAETVLDMVAGAPVAAQVILPTELIVRQSCGCFASDAVQSVTGDANGVQPVAEARHTLNTPPAPLAELARIVAEQRLDISVENAQRVLDAMLAEATGQTRGRFLPALNRLLRQTQIDGSQVSWYRVVATLRRHMRDQLGTPELMQRAEDLWQQAQILIGETERRTEMRQGWNNQQQAAAFRHLGQSLITTFDVAELMDVVARELPGLGIPRCYVALYENPAQPDDHAQLILGYDEQGRAELPPGGLRFPAQELLPADVWRPDVAYNLIVEALFFKGQQLGFVIFEASLREDWVYETLRGELSSSLKGALLVAQEERRSQQLQAIAEMGALLPTIVDPAILLQRIADDTKTRLQLYHANVYMLDDAGDTLVLAAGAGDIGPALVAQGGHIRLDNAQSPIARAARTRHSVIMSDTREKPDQHVSPLLPNARALIALPLMVGDHLLGVLEAQSADVNAFASTDLTIQNTFARQIAAALQNARLYQALERQNQVAEEARSAAEEANAFKSQFLANMSHELRTPLNAILNFTRFMSKERYGVLTERQSEIQQRILVNADHLLGLINDILDLSKIEAGHMDLFREATNLEPLLQGVMSTAMGLTKEKGLALTLDCPAGLPYVWIDKTRIRQVLLNLLSNAAKFTKEGGITLRVVHTGDTVQLAIEDTGIGIAREHQALIFEEFRQVQGGLTRQYQGTGLGLAISKRFVELHGGRMWLDSTPDVGSTFSFTVPVYHE